MLIVGLLGSFVRYFGFCFGKDGLLFVGFSGSVFWVLLFFWGK